MSEEITITLKLSQEEREGIRWVRAPEHEKPVAGDMADEQECKEHLDGFIEQAVEEMDA